MEFIDIHNHIAWDIDDGIQNKEEAFKTLQSAYHDKVKKIIATPHFIPGQHDKNDVMCMNKRIQEVKNMAKKMDIEIYEGCELFLNDEYLDMIDNGLCNTLANSNYLLCEFDVRKDIKNNPFVEDILYEIKLRDLIPVVAHVERYFHSDINIKMIKNWIDNGYVIQVNRTSLLGIHGEMVKKNAFKLLKEGLVHVIASDTHRATGRRVCKFMDVYKIVREYLGEENTDILFQVNPVNIIENRKIINMKVKPKKKLWFSKLRRR